MAETETKNLAPWAEAVVEAKENFLRINRSVGAVDWVTEANFATQRLRENPTLAQCDPKSIRDAVTNIAAVGLSLNPAEKLAYLVPRDGKCVLDISYQGLLKIATDTGSIKWARAELVYEGEEFNYKGPAEKPEHIANPFDSRRGTPEGFVGAYCIAKTVDGDYLVETMSAEQVFKVRDCSKAYTKWAHKRGEEWKAGPWVEWFGEMVKKSIIKRSQKTWPRTQLTSRLDKAIEVLNEHEGLEYTEEQRSFYVRMIEKRNDPLEFLAFIESLPQRAHIALYNHWPQGHKVANKQRHDKLAGEGRELLARCIESINEAYSSRDEGGVREVMDEVSQNVRELILSRLEQDPRDYCEYLGYTVMEPVS